MKITDITRTIYQKKFLIISTSFIMLFILMFFPVLISSENPEIAGVEYDFCVTTEEISEETLIPMRQFTDKTDLQINRFAENYFIFRLKDKHMLVISGEKEIRADSEVYDVDTAPVKVNDDILIPYNLAKSFLEDGILENIEVGEINEKEERTGLHLILSPEAKEISRGDSFEVKVELRNFTDRKASFTFNTGQKFELELVDDEGSVVFKWSRGQMFTQAIQRIELEPGEIKTWTARINTSGLRSESYRLEGWLTDQRKSLTAEPVEIEIK